MTNATGPARPSRRRFIGVATGATALAGSTIPVAPAAASQTSLPQPAAAIDLPMLRAAQAVNGMAQSDEALGKALSLVTRYKTHIEGLRGVPIATEVEPAFGFDPRRGRKPRLPRNSVKPAASAQSRSRSAPAAPSSATEIAFAPAETLRAWLDARKVSSEELATLCLNRLIRFDATLSCVVTLANDRAIVEARQADSERSGAKAGLLHGIPYGAKDIIDSAGIRTLWGARPYRDRPIPKADATVIARLTSSRGCLTAKLSSGELAIGDTWGGEAQYQDGRSLSGMPEGIKTRKTKNPWDPTTGASGSSAGPAAAVSAGLVPFALGTETGGSIISPASTCGVVGLRPTYGRVSRHGVMTLRWTLDKVGVLARSVADCGAVLQTIHGADGLDGAVTMNPFSWNAGTSKAGKLRLGIVESELFTPPENTSEKERAAFAERRVVFESAVEIYRRLGFEIVPVALPNFNGPALYAIHNAEAGAMFDDITRNASIDELEGQGPNDRSSQLRASRFISAVDYLRAQRVRTLMIDAVEQMFDQVDLFLAPPTSDSLNMTNLTGHPAIALPAGFVKGATGLDMPQNIMLTGRLDDEATLLDTALAFERETPWHERRPPGFA